MVPEMSGGVFWEHLHRLVAGGLVLMFLLATWLAKKETSDQPWIFRTCLAGLGLLLVQSVFGGLTVLYQLPDLVSTTHLSLAFIFLALATMLATATHGSSPGAGAPRIGGFGNGVGPKLRIFAGVSAALVFIQSALGALVRHTDGGMSCPDVPLCLGQVVPPLVNIQITSHFLHRFMALVATAAILGLLVWAYRADMPARVRRWVVLAAVLVVAQVALGVVSVLTILAVVPVSVHTLVAAGLLGSLVAVATMGSRAATQ
jgi:heme A synthase